MLNIDEMIEDILGSVRLAMESAGVGDKADEVVATVSDYIVNHYGEEFDDDPR